MKAERQQKERTSRVLQSKQGKSRLAFIDNRPETTAQKHVIQKLTALAYAPAYQRPGAGQIMAMRHARVPMRAWEQNVAAQNCGYVDAANAPGFCNHHVPYAMVRDGVENTLNQSVNLTNAVNWVTGVNIGGNIPQANIPNTGTAVAPTYDENTLNLEIDDMVANVANDPRNLFYWPGHTGDQGGTVIDEPWGAGPVPVGGVRNGLQAYQATLRAQNII